MSREIRVTETESDSKPNSIRKFFCSQAGFAYYQLFNAPEVTERKWQELSTDVNFGAELKYICQRAFYYPPYSVHGRDGVSLSGRGWYKDVMNPKTIQLCVEVGIALPGLELETSMPLCILNNLKELETRSAKVQFPDLRLLKQWWRIHPKFGVEPINNFSILVDTDNQFKLWNPHHEASQDINSVDTDDDDLKLRVTQSTLLSCFHDYLSMGNMLVSVTGSFCYISGHKVLVRILKPQKK